MYALHCFPQLDDDLFEEPADVVVRRLTLLTLERNGRVHLLRLILLRSFAWPLVLSLAVPPSAVFGYRVDNTLEHIEE